MTLPYNVNERHKNVEVCLFSESGANVKVITRDITAIGKWIGYLQ